MSNTNFVIPKDAYWTDTATTDDFCFDCGYPFDNHDKLYGATYLINGFGRDRIFCSRTCRKKYEDRESAAKPTIGILARMAMEARKANS